MSLQALESLYSQSSSWEMYQKDINMTQGAPWGEKMLSSWPLDKYMANLVMMRQNNLLWHQTRLVFDNLYIWPELTLRKVTVESQRVIVVLHSKSS